MDDLKALIEKLGRTKWQLKAIGTEKKTKNWTFSPNVPSSKSALPPRGCVRRNKAPHPASKAFRDWFEPKQSRNAKQNHCVG